VCFYLCKAKTHLLKMTIINIDYTYERLDPFFILEYPSCQKKFVGLVCSSIESSSTLLSQTTLYVDFVVTMYSAMVEEIKTCFFLVGP